jgi:hypothetical protein
LFLLEQQRVYWRQRGAIKWATLGDAGTKFFHSNATLRHRINYISSLKNEQGECLYSHVAKEGLLWDSFRERIGISEFSEMHFDLTILFQGNTDLSSLEEPFTAQEIDSTVKMLPNDKSPGPDGFSNEFIKNCWPTIREDFYSLF